ncbi:recombinase family protein [Cellulosilyticum sp. WCF-2]|uniref:recombinase family protein n=1 Tax=Cellulosilyticum sp. WCF-2 TaxID=2497860 RepID=UPI001FAAF4F9|nr:recombinase family protein [Cellulosilyticum sp. WCF-2]
MSLNSTWGVRRRFEQGKVTINEKKFLGYDKDSEGNLIINETQAVIVRRIYKDFLDEKGTAHITRELEQEKVKNWNGTTKWYESTIKSILQNEKYKGDAILQKTYTVDFLTKERVKNTGKVPKYYVEESHPAIIAPETWQAVQLEMERRKKFCMEHGIKNLDTRIPFGGKVICGICGSVYSRKTWMQPDGTKRKVWMCSNRYKEKGVKGCESKHVNEEVLQKAFVAAFNELVTNKQYFLEKWKGELEDSNALKQYRLNEFIGILEQEEKQEQFNESLCLRILEQIELFDNKGTMHITLLDGMSMKCENNN